MVKCKVKQAYADIRMHLARNFAGQFAELRPAEFYRECPPPP